VRSASSVSLSIAMWVGMCAAVMALTQNTAAPQNNLPRGWRAPTREEASGSWRQKSPTQFLKVKGDFDGDGRVDVAQILVDPSAGKFGLFVKLGGATSGSSCATSTSHFSAAMGSTTLNPENTRRHVARDTVTGHVPIKSRIGYNCRIPVLTFSIPKARTVSISGINRPRSFEKLL
jgi:hypothetical protein